MKSRRKYTNEENSNSKLTLEIRNRHLGPADHKTKRRERKVGSIIHTVNGEVYDINNNVDVYNVDNVDVIIFMLVVVTVIIMLILI